MIAIPVAKTIIAAYSITELTLAFLLCAIISVGISIVVGD
jgi:hypothetical protein